MKIFQLYIIALLLLSTTQLSAIDIVRPESALYDSTNKRWLCSLVGEHNTPDGSVIVIDETGKALSVFTTGLDDPKGMVVAFDKLYVADLTNLRIIDLATGELLETIAIEGSQFLNDVCFNQKDKIYISDNVANAIFVYNPFTKVASKLCDVEMPNGMLYDEAGNSILAVSFYNTGKIFEISLMNGNVKTKATVSQKFMDGIARDNLGNYYLSSWQTQNVVKYDKNFSNPVEYKKGYNGPADIYFESTKNILVVPEMEGGRINFYPFSPSPSKPEDLEPVDGTSQVSVTPKFSWAKSENSVGYIVSINKDREFPPQSTITVVIDGGDSTDFVQDSPALDYESIYYWYVEAIGESDITSSDTLSFSTIPNTSVNDNSTEISIYPNPTQDEICLSANGINLSGTKIEIYSLDSKLVYNSNTISESIDITNLDKGLYFVIIKDGRKIIKETAFIKK